MISVSLNKKIGNIFIAFLLFMGIAWRVQDCFRLNIWTDEKFSLETSSGSLRHTWERSIYYEHQTPPYFLILNLWRRINSSLEFSRLLSVIFSILSIFYIYKIWKYLFGDTWKWVAPLVYTFNSFHLWAASEVRLYAMVIFLCTASTYHFLRISVNKQNRLKNSDYFWYFVWCVLGIYTFYPLGFLIAGHFMASLFLLGRDKVRALVLCYILMGISLMFLLPVLKIHFLYSISWADTNKLEFNLINESKISNYLILILVPFYQVAKSVIYIPSQSIIAKIFIFVIFYSMLTLFFACRILFEKKKLTREEKILMTITLTPFILLSLFHSLDIGVSNVRYYAVTSIISLLFVVIAYNIENNTLKKIIVGFLIAIFLTSSIQLELQNPKAKPEVPSQKNLVSKTIIPISAYKLRIF